MGRKRKTRKRKQVENLKEKFRQSQEWKDFRIHIAQVFDHRDYLTGRKLAKGYNVHHMKPNQEPESYCDLSNEANFMPLNSYSHKLLHYIFTYYKKDKTVLNRLQEILDKMCLLASEGKCEQGQDDFLGTETTSPDSSNGSLGNETVSYS